MTHKTTRTKQEKFDHLLADYKIATVYLREHVPGLIGDRVYGRISQVDPSGVVVMTMYPHDEVKVFHFFPTSIAYIDYDTEILNKQVEKYEHD